MTNDQQPATDDHLKSFDRVAEVYDETRGLPPEVAGAIAEGIAEIACERTDAPHLLEVGVGTGRMAVPLAERGVRVTGIDIAPKMLALLRSKRHDIDVMLAEAALPPLRDGAFDAALFVHILHLVPDAEATVRATVALLRAGGVMIQGGDDRSAGPRDEAEQIIERAVLDVAGIDLGAWRPHDVGMSAFTNVCTGAGAELERRTLATWTGAVKGSRMIERLATKSYSSSWRIPDEHLPAILERVTPQLAAFFGDLDREVELARSFSVTVARLP